MDEYGNGHPSGQITPPSGTPKWALGFAFVSSMVVSVGVTAYLSVAPDFRTYLANKKETDLANIASADVNNKRLTEGVLSVVDKCAINITELSRSLGVLANERDTLSRTVNLLTDELQKQKLTSVKWEKDLEVCMAKKAR